MSLSLYSNPLPSLYVCVMLINTNLVLNLQGAAGVERVLSVLKDELKVDMALTGTQILFCLQELYIPLL